jgi:8-oxo-dGTP pyrophosphatase MutT (NUDIX family)
VLEAGMALRPWRKISEQVVTRNPWWTYRLDRVVLPSGREGEYHVISNAGSAMVVPLCDDGRILLVNQYRYIDGRESLELPGGGVKPGASAEASARAELAEETGRAAARLELAGRFNPYTGVSDEICHVFVARGLSAAPPTPPDETEELELVSITPAEVEARIRGGVIWDGMSIAAWHLARPLLDEPAEPGAPAAPTGRERAGRPGR